MIYSPYILEKSSQHLSTLDVFSKLAQNRILFLGGDITEDSANVTIAQLLYLDSISKSDITLYVSSHGGSVYDGMAICDTIDLLKSNVNTIIVGKACSMGAIIALYGKERYALKSSKIMLHQPSGGTYGNATELEIYVNELNKEKVKIFNIIKQKTLMSLPEDELLFDKWMDPEEALKYNIITKIL